MSYNNGVTKTSVQPTEPKALWYRGRVKSLPWCTALTHGQHPEMSVIGTPAQRWNTGVRKSDRGFSFWFSKSLGPEKRPQKKEV